MTVAAQRQEEVTALAVRPGDWKEATTTTWCSLFKITKTSITKHGSALMDRALAGSWSTSRDRGSLETL
ncbi:hypothetical protein OsJ_06074 [Oryza sativa Japonica Group]|uniref:Uncharacterized protein n=1 Tax=Oryza sativa subsp. japonica TaxID=39947 RepID=B9F4S7_ORYSJ|nr:hypothetical protein OsJ_06074 [Oryza sativa Japonica Group]